MDTDRLNRWLTLGANIGVLLGIILLVVELGQNHEMMRAQIRNEISRAEIDVLGQTAGNRDLSEVITRANSGEELTSAERFMVRTRNESVFRLWQNAHYQYRLEMYDESEYSKHLATMAWVIKSNPSLMVYWCELGELYSDPFMLEIDKILADYEC